MTAALGIVWFIALLFSIFCINETSRMSAMVSMFPEGWRWWVPVTKFASLALFAALIHWHPFSTVLIPRS